MADDDDAEYEAAADEDAYDMSSLTRRQPENPHFGASRPMPMAPVEPEDSGPLPEWAAQFQARRGESERERLTGTCAKWHVAKGFGFITRDDGGPDVYVHQRDLKKDGFRSLMEGELVEFELGRMADDRLYAIKVTGPGYKEVIGQPPKEDEDAEDEADQRGAGGPTRKADEKKVPAKPYKPALAFKPRTIKPKAPQPPKPKAASAGAAPSAPSAPAAP